MKLIGYKKRQLFDELILPHLPSDLENYMYVEPFGGTFSVASGSASDVPGGPPSS